MTLRAFLTIVLGGLALFTVALVAIFVLLVGRNADERRQQRGRTRRPNS
jgi:hypothetical protein